VRQSVECIYGDFQGERNGGNRALQKQE